MFVQLFFLLYSEFCLFPDSNVGFCWRSAALGLQPAFGLAHSSESLCRPSLAELIQSHRGFVGLGLGWLHSRQD